VATVPAGAGTGNVKVTVNGVASAEGFLIVPWQDEDPVNVAISQAMDGQFGAQLISGSAGGAIIVWQDSRIGIDDIYAQGITPSGRQ